MQVPAEAEAKESPKKLLRGGYFECLWQWSIHHITVFIIWDIFNIYGVSAVTPNPTIGCHCIDLVIWWLVWKFASLTLTAVSDDINESNKINEDYWHCVVGK
jgi:hypothetical protein